MKHTLLPFICLLIGVPGVFAAKLSPDQALARLQKSMPARVRSCSVLHSGNPELTATVGNLYVFTGSTGYMILPAEDFSPALLGYSESGEFDIAGNPALAEWLDFYNREIEYMKTRADGSSEKARVKRTEKSVEPRSGRMEIAPLLQTEWNQEYPYNELCPKVDGRETVTGCVATAMAQVMKFYNYPPKGKGSHSYFWRPGEEELTFDYDSVPFRWDLMEDRYDSQSSAESRCAVAELMLGCGVSVDMHYEPGGSGAATTAMGESLIDIFGYSSALWMPNRTFYGYDEWEGMIYDDLAKGLPVLYSGAGTAGGHQFVCDGYRADGYFHFNWGWGGLSNGYFLLTALNPDDLGVGGGAGGFNTSQIATLGVRPATEDDKPVYVIYNTTAFRSAVEKVKEGEDLRFTGEYFNYSLATLPDGSRLGVKIESETGDTVRFADGPGVGGLHLYDGRVDLQIRFPEIPDGKYRLTPALHVDGKWLPVRMPVGYPSSVTAVVKDKEVTLYDEEAASVEITDIEIPAVIYRNHEFPLRFSVENTGKAEYYGTVTPALFDSTGTVIAESDFRPLDVLPGSHQRIGDYIGKFVALKDKEFPAGEYRLLFHDNASDSLNRAVTVRVEINDAKTEIRVTDFKLDGPETIADPDSVKFRFDVKCETGVYFGRLRVDVFPGDGGYALASADSPELYLSEGESRTAEVNADFHELKEGTYMAALYNGGESLTGTVYFHITRTDTGVEDIESDRVTSEIFDLQGHRIHGNLSPGLYIIGGRKILVR